MSEWIITSSVLILVIMALRFVLKGKTSLRLQYMLWAVVLVRLLIPFNITSSSISVMNYVDEAKEQIEIDAMETTEFESAAASIDVAVLNVEEKSNRGYVWDYNEAYARAQENEADNAQIIEANADASINLENTVRFIIDVAGYIWISGMFLTGVWFVFVNARFARKLKNSRLEMGPEYGKAILPVYTSENIDTPCLYGTRKPKIYVTPEILRNEKALKHVLEHETTHYRHGDHIWCVLRMAAIVLHWYNPLVWLAAFMSQKDAELACDEGTIKRIGESERIEYGRTLIDMVCKNKGRLFVVATGMSGSKNSIKERIVLIAKKPRTAIYTLIAVVLAMATVIGCTFTSASAEVPKVTMAEPDIVIEAEPMAAVKKPKAEEPEVKEPEAVVAEDKESTYTWQIYDDVIIFNGTGVIERGDYVNENFSEVYITEGITGIGPRAFACLDKLEKVRMADSVTEIGAWAFCYCENLYHIDLSENCIKFGVNAFEKTLWLEQMMAMTANSEKVMVNGISIARGSKAIEAPVATDATRIVYGEAGSYYEKFAHKLGIVFKEIERKTEEFSLGTEIYYLFNGGGMDMTLYKTRTGSTGTYECVDDYYVEWLADVLYSYRWIETEKPASMGNGYRIVIESISAEADRQMIFYENMNGLVEYCNGDVTTYWIAEADKNELSVFDNVRRVHDEREADGTNIAIHTNKVKYAAEIYVTQGYANQLYLLNAGNAYKISKYKLIDWGITSQEDYKLTGWFEFAFKPHKTVEEADKEVWTANTRAGEGEYAGMYIKKAEFDMEMYFGSGPYDYRWLCTDFEWIK